MITVTTKSNGPLQRIVQMASQEALDRAAREALTTVLAVQKQRIFTKSGGKNSAGVTFGKYNAKYEKRRQKKFKRSNRNINLVASSEMLTSYTLGPTKEGWALGFQAKANGVSGNPNAAQKAEYMEERFGNIFQMNSKEKKIFIETYKAALKRGN